MVRDMGGLIKTLEREVFTTLDDRTLRKVTRMFGKFKERYHVDLMSVRGEDGVTRDSADMAEFLNGDSSRFKRLEDEFLKKHGKA